MTDLYDEWVLPSERLPIMGQRIRILLSPKQNPPYDRLPKEVEAVAKLHWYYQTMRFTPEWRTSDSKLWCLYVEPCQVTHWRPSPTTDRIVATEEMRV